MLVHAAAAKGARLVVFPELSLTGYELYACGAIFGTGSEQRILEQATGRARETGMSFLFA